MQIPQDIIKMNRQEIEYDITLSSLAGGSKYSNINTIAKFTNPLSRTVSLNGEWGVAVKKVSYHNNLINIHPGQNKIEYKGYRYNRVDDLSLPKNISDGNYSLTTHYIFEVPAPGSYMNPQVFIDTLHKLYSFDPVKPEISRLGELVQFEYLEATQTIQIKNVPRHHDFEFQNEVKELTLSPGLASMAGLVWNETYYSCKFKLFNSWVWDNAEYKEKFF